MIGSHHQRVDLLLFGQMVQRLAVQRAVTARNAGKITDEQMDLIGEYLPTVGDVNLLLDEFTPSVDVSSAVAELEPAMPTLRRVLAERLGARKVDVPPQVVQATIKRVEAALRYLKVDPR